MGRGPPAPIGDLGRRATGRLSRRTQRGPVLVHVDLEPDLAAVLRQDPPPVGDPVDEVEAPAGSLARRRPPRRRFETASWIRYHDADPPGLGPDPQLDLGLST